ncbi:MAG TPA: hypothetical protein VIG99_15105 [Myxococcaceae bacterium]|jgi:hypothetical protein
METIAPTEEDLPPALLVPEQGRWLRDRRLDGSDAPPSDPDEEGLAGLLPVEPEPTSQDILPDLIYRRGAEPDEEALTAQPREWFHAIRPEELPPR